MGGRDDGISQLNRNKPAAGSLRTRLELALDFGDGTLLSLLNELFFPDLHLGQNILNGDATHSIWPVLKSHLGFLSSMMEGINEQTGILAPRPDPCRAIISIKADDRFAERACEMQRTGIGRDDQLASIQNGDETTKTTTQRLLGGMTTLLDHFLAQGGFSCGVGSDQYGV